MKEKTSRLILSMTFIFTLIISLCLSIQAYADFNGDQGAGEQNANKFSNGISTANQGFLLYVADIEHGCTMTPGSHTNSDINPLPGSSSIGVSRQENPILKGDITYPMYVTKCDGAYPEHWAQYDDAPLGVKWNGSSWVPNGAEVMNWLKEKGDSGMYWYEKLLLDAYGQDFIDQLHDHADEWVVCVEFFHWNKVIVGDKKGYYTGDKLLGTNDGWAIFYKNCGYDEATDADRNRGNYYIRSYTHKMAMFSMTLATSYWGLTAHAGAAARQLTFDEIRPNGTGSQNAQTDYGLQIITLDSSSIHTYWEANGSPGDPEPATKSSKQGTCNIVKGYYTENETTGQRTSDGVFTEEKVTNNIVIGNEPEYQIVSWGISTTYSPSVDPTAWNPPGTITRTGKISTTVKLDTTTTKETTVYVLLKKVEQEDEEPEDEDYDYLLTESQVTRRVWFSQPDQEIHLTKTTLLEHDFNFTKPATDPQECAGHSYYTKCKGHHDDHQATGQKSAGHNDNCSRDKDGNIDCSDSHTESYTYTCTSCTAKTYYNTDYACEKCTDTDYCLDWKWLDMNQNISLDATLTGADTIVVWENAADTYKAHTVKGNDGLSKQWYSTNGTDVTWSDELEQKYLSEYTNWVNKDKTTSKDWNYICILARGQDLVTIAEWKNSGTPLKDMLDSGKFTEANQPQGTRYQKNKGTDTYYYEQFTAEFDKDTDSKGDYEVEWGPTKVMSQSAHKVSSDICPVEPTVSLMTPLTINDITVKVEVYIGKENLSDQAITYTRTTEHDPIYGSWAIQKDTTSGTMVEAEDINFYPYVQMQYDTMAIVSKKGAEQTVQVLGEYMRTIKTNAYGEVEWDDYNANGKSNLTVNSAQFSTHANAVKESFRKGSVLPGGATLTLKVKKENFRTITVRTYQIILEGDGKEQVEKTTGTSISNKLTESYAAQQHNSFVATVVSALQNTKLNQYVSTDGSATDAMSICTDSNLVYEGSSLSLGNGSSKASEEAKYYLQGGRGDSNSPYLDAETTGTNTTRYVISSNANGDILLDGSRILSKSQSSGLSGIAAEIDEKTKVISEFAAAIERNSGSDSKATWLNPNDGKWYNEQFDGFTVLVMETTIQVGTWQPNERHTVLDPKLIPQQTKKTSSWSFFSTAWRTDNYSQNYPDIQTKIGEFRGETVKLVDYKTLFVSDRVIYIPSVTTQDLR